MARAESITFEEFRTRFSTEDACRTDLFRLRFPNGFVCPKCGCTEYYPVRGRNTFQCRACRHQTSVTAGTVMHRTHLPLTAWFWAIYLCATDKRGISAVQLSRTLSICYESAWYLLRRIRSAMRQRDEKYELSDIVEMDDGYIGGATHNGKRGRGTDKAKIVLALSKTENGAALFTRMQVVEDVTGGTLQQVVDETVAPGSKIECDGYKSYRDLSGVALDAKKYEPGDLLWLHKAISNLKAFLLGTYHGRCTQLQAYLDEFCFRFNRRKTGDQIFRRLVRAVATACAQLHEADKHNEKFTPMMRGREQVVPIQEKFLITVPEAAKYFGIGTKQMRRLAENHLSDFAIFMGNRYLIVRPRFEEYVIDFMASGEKQFR